MVNTTTQADRPGPLAYSGHFVRAVQLDGIAIRTGGTGRTVDAYATVFDVPAEIMDADGHYREVNHPTSFNRTIQHRSSGGFPVIYHHGMTLTGTASDRGSVPIGVSREVTADKRGVRTVWEAAKTELADEVLEAIRQGSITGQSYGGRFLRSDPRRPPGGYRAGHDGQLRTVTRLEVAMTEFGPTPFPAFAEAAIVGLRAQQLLTRLVAADPSQLRTLLGELDQLATLPDADPDSFELSGTSGNDPAGAAADTPPLGPSPRRAHLNARIRAAFVARGLECP